MPLSTAFDRATGIGASEIAKVCGISFWQKNGGPHSVWLAKKGVFVVEKSSSTSTVAGDDAEFLAERVYRRMTGMDLAPLLDDDGQPLTLRHPEMPWVYASIDRVRTIDLIPVEIKWMGGLRAHWFEGRRPRCSYCGRGRALHWGPNPEDVPDDVQAQVQWQLLVTGAPFAEVVRFWMDSSGCNTGLYSVKKDPRTIEFLLEKGRDFWYNHVVANVPPDPDDSSESERCERARYSSVIGDAREAPAGTEKYVAMYLEGKRLEEEGAKRKGLASNWLRRICGDSSRLVGPGFKVTNTMRTDGTRVLRVIGESNE